MHPRASIRVSVADEMCICCTAAEFSSMDRILPTIVRSKIYESPTYINASFHNYSLHKARSDAAMDHDYSQRVLHFEVCLLIRPSRLPQWSLAQAPQTNRLSALFNSL
jgi:hypothetical protein